MGAPARLCTKCNQPLPAAQAAVRSFPTCAHEYHLPGCIATGVARCPRCREISIGLTVAGAAAGALLAPVVAPLALGVVGFSAAGPVIGAVRDSCSGNPGIHR